MRLRLDKAPLRQSMADRQKYIIASEAWRSAFYLYCLNKVQTAVSPWGAPRTYVIDNNHWLRAIS